MGNAKFDLHTHCERTCSFTSDAPSVVHLEYPKKHLEWECTFGGGFDLLLEINITRVADYFTIINRIVLCIALPFLFTSHLTERQSGQS